MNLICLKIVAAIIFLVMFGCAAPSARVDVDGQLNGDSTPATKTESVYMTNQPERKKEAAEIVTLECLTAHKLGCRFKGRLYPWNAWVEKMGYKASQYTIRDVQQTGNKAVVTLIGK